MRRLGVVWMAIAMMGVQAMGAESQKPAAAQGAEKGQWAAIPDGALTVKAEGGKNLSIAGGAIAGIAVDRTNGDVYAVLQNKRGVVKSEDQGASFKDFSPLKVGQSPICSASLSVDPAGKRAAVFTIIDGLGGMTMDAGKTWTDFKGETDVKSQKGLGRCFDFGAVDWEAGGKAILAAIHESKGREVLSTDGGATWKELGAGYSDKGPIGIIDEKTLLTTKGKTLSRSTDGGTTWTKATDLPQGPRNPVIYVVKGVCYLMTENGLMVSKDKGATWAVQGSAVKASIGPFFGKDEEHLVAVGKEGFYMTKDGGKAWAPVAPLAPGLGPRDVTYAWDPIHNILYAAQHGKPAMKCVVGAASGNSK